MNLKLRSRPKVGRFGLATDELYSKSWNDCSLVYEAASDQVGVARNSSPSWKPWPQASSELAAG